MNPINFNVRVDTTNLNKGIEASARYSGRTMPQLVNTAAYWIAINAKAATPFVTPERVDQELSVIPHPVIGKRGKPLKNKKTYSGTRMVTVTRKGVEREVPLAVMIVAARTRSDSKYNALTGGRYALGQSPFKGLSRAAGRAAMAHLVDAMIKARHRSGKFLLAGWIPVIQELKPLSAQKFIRGGARPLEGRGNYYGKDLGRADPAPEGLKVSARIMNMVGMEGLNAQSMNRALVEHGLGPLEDAVNREGVKQMDYALKKMEAEHARTVQPHWK